MSRLVAESQSVRRIIGRLDVGEDLLRGLISVCKSRNVRCGLIQATGMLEKLTVAHYEPARKAMGQPLEFGGPLALLSATGTLSELGGKLELSLQVVASRQGDNGVDLLGGTCTSARVTACEFVIEALDDLLLRRSADHRTGLYVWTDAISAHVGSSEPEPQELRPPLSGLKLMDPPAQQVPTVVIKEAPAMVEEPAEPEEEEEEHEPYRPVQIGDMIMHQQFGECLVQRVSVDQEYATVRRLANKRLVRLSLEVLDLHFQKEEDGHQVFEARPASR